MGEGAGILVLEVCFLDVLLSIVDRQNMQHALNRGARIYGTIRGYGTSGIFICNDL